MRDCDHTEFLDFDCGEYQCSDCGQEFTVWCDGNEGKCLFCKDKFFQLREVNKRLVESGLISYEQAKAYEDSIKDEYPKNG